MKAKDEQNNSEPNNGVKKHISQIEKLTLEDILPEKLTEPENIELSTDGTDLSEELDFIDNDNELDTDTFSLEEQELSLLSELPEVTENNIEKQNIFLSYSSKNNSIADEIDQTIGEILSNYYTIRRDVRDLGYKNSIKEFMKSVSEQDFVLMLISQAFLTSDNCMFEVLEAMKSNHYKEKMLFIILDDANI